MALFTLKQVVYKEIIKYPDLTIQPQGATFIRGESGAGKSTLLKLLNGAITPDSGEITYKGQNLNAWDTVALRREVLLASQQLYLFDGSVAANFRAFYQYRNQQPPDRAAMEEYLHLCAAACAPEADCQVMSGGEKQRVFLAICLSFQPQVLMLDEPTSALDDHLATVMLNQIKDYCRSHGLTLLVVSHSRELTEALADEIISLP